MRFLPMSAEVGRLAGASCQPLFGRTLFSRHTPTGGRYDDLD